MKRTVEQVKNLWMQIEMPDGRLFAVPVLSIARSRAENYKDEFGNDVERSLVEDTLPLFADSDYEIKDWASNNMNWDDVSFEAVEIDTVEEEPADYQEGWVNGNKSFLTFVEGKTTTKTKEISVGHD